MQCAWRHVGDPVCVLNDDSELEYIRRVTGIRVQSKQPLSFYRPKDGKEDLGLHAYTIGNRLRGVIEAAHRFLRVVFFVDYGKLAPTLAARFQGHRDRTTG
ncbi:unnamed protein product, partial [Laminaria digitata]